MRDEIVRKIEKWQEPPPAKIIKPLKAPDAEGKKRRGGKRLRKMKERYGMSDMRKVRRSGACGSSGTSWGQDLWPHGPLRQASSHVDRSYFG